VVYSIYPIFNYLIYNLKQNNISNIEKLNNKIFELENQKKQIKILLKEVEKLLNI